VASQSASTQHSQIQVDCGVNASSLNQRIAARRRHALHATERPNGIVGAQRPLPRKLTWPRLRVVRRNLGLQSSDSRMWQRYVVPTVRAHCFASVPTGGVFVQSVTVSRPCSACSKSRAKIVVLDWQQRERGRLRSARCQFGQRSEALQSTRAARAKWASQPSANNRSLCASASSSASSCLPNRRPCTSSPS